MHMSYILGMIYNYSRTMELGTTGESTAICKLHNKSHGNNKVYRQAIDRAYNQTNERTISVFRLVRLACQPFVGRSKKVRAVHQQSDPVFIFSALGEKTNIRKLRRGVQVGFVQESDDRGIRRAAGRVCVEGTPAHRDCKDKQP